MTNEDHNRYIGFAFLANAGFYLLILGFMALLFLYMGFAAPPSNPGPPPFFFAFIFGFLAVIYGILATPSIVASYGLLKKKHWARTASIIAAVVAGMNFPIGTGACAYALWFFLSDNWKEVYACDPNFHEPRQIAYGVETQRAAYAEAERQPKPRFDPYNPPDWR